MKSLILSMVSVESIISVADLTAREHFLQTRVERSRRCIPNDFDRVGSPTAVSAVVSETAVLILRPTRETRDPTDAPQQVKEAGRAFVFSDVQAGPLVLTGLAVRSDSPNGTILATGVLTHSGGDAGQLPGGKAVIRVEPLAVAGTSAQGATALASQECSCWVCRDQPEMVRLFLKNPAFLPGGIWRAQPSSGIP